jgi:hypothetical protein
MFRNHTLASLLCTDMNLDFVSVAMEIDADALRDPQQLMVEVVMERLAEA